MCMPSGSSDFQNQNSISAAESEDEDEFDDCDSGAGSDDFDLLELGESGEEFCQIGDQTCSIPYELYDLQGLGDVLSMDVWNEVLTEEERFELSKYLPDMDQENFVCTLKELFSGANLDFGNPVAELFKMLKGGLCEPRLALYRQGVIFVQRRQHYHNLRKYQNSTVTNLCQIRDAWASRKGYSIEEKLRVLNIVNSQRSLMSENMEVHGSEPSEREESNDGLWGKKTKEHKASKKMGRYSGYGSGMASDMSYYGKTTAVETFKHGKQKPKGTLKSVGSSSKDVLEEPIATSHGLETISGLPGYGIPRYNEELGEDDDKEPICEVFVHGDQGNDNIGAYKLKKREVTRGKTPADNLTHAFGRKKNVDRFFDTDMLAANTRNIHDGGKKHMKVGKGKKSDFSLKESRNDLLKGKDPAFFSKNGGLFSNYSSYKPSEAYFEANHLEGKSQSSASHYNRRDALGKKDITSFSRSEETESDSSEQADGVDDDNPLMRSKWAYPSGVQELKLDSRKKTVDRFNIDRNLEMQSERESKMFDVNTSVLPTNDFSQSYFPGTENSLGVDQGQIFFPLGSNGHVEGHHAGSLRRPSVTGVGKKKGEVYRDVVNLQHNHLPDYNLEDDLYWTRNPASENGVPSKTGGKDQAVDASAARYHYERQEMSLLGCNTFSKKRKTRNDLQENPDDIGSSRKRGKGKIDNAYGVQERGIPEPDVMEVEEEEEVKPQKKSVPIITPTVHTGFSFSIIHFLSATRVAMITPLPQDTAHAAMKFDNPNADDSSSNGAAASVPSLTLHEIVTHVRSNPLDPSILETQEPLHDLVRGVLKILSSRTAPLGAKGWKPLVAFEKPKKTWSWVGPVPHNDEEVTSPDSWGLPHKMLVKLVDSLANWLKNSQETLKQIGSLPPPPPELFTNVDEKERFKDLRAQKSLSTITPSSEEARAYFRKEEELRYLIPDRAFSYTAADGKKSIVAPLRRCGGKPTSKARDHFMLRRDRPPHVTILCLVRDAAARLPGSIGTRADVCTLIRDSQYVVEEVSEAQVNQVVSGALDRLHYERDPCVLFDGERKLWVYLHRDREEEDFEDDGTSSTKKWKRQKKDAAEGSEGGEDVITVVARSGLDVEASGGGGDDKALESGDLNGVGVASAPVIGSGGALDSGEGDEVFCRENSTGEEFQEDDSFGGDDGA